MTTIPSSTGLPLLPNQKSTPAHATTPASSTPPFIGQTTIVVGANMSGHPLPSGVILSTTTKAVDQSSTLLLGQGIKVNPLLIGGIILLVVAGIIVFLVRRK